MRNPSYDEQAVMRIFRQGQTKETYVYRLVAQGSMEEKIYCRNINKLQLAKRLGGRNVPVKNNFYSKELELYLFKPKTQTHTGPTLYQIEAVEESPLTKLLAKCGEQVSHVTRHEDYFEQVETTEEEMVAAEKMDIDDEADTQIVELRADPIYSRFKTVTSMSDAIATQCVVVVRIWSAIISALPNSRHDEFKELVALIPGKIEVLDSLTSHTYNQVS